jgi:hypothetical protein
MSASFLTVVGRFSREDRNMEDGLEYKLWYGPEPMITVPIEEAPSQPEILVPAERPPMRKGGKLVPAPIPEWLIMGAVVTLDDGTECQVTYIDKDTGNWFCVPVGKQ